MHAYSINKTLSKDFNVNESVTLTVTYHFILKIANLNFVAAEGIRVLQTHLVLLQTLAKSLQQLLDYDGDDIEDVFMQSFSIGYKDVFGSDLSHDLKDRGGEVMVNQGNKQVCYSI